MNIKELSIGDWVRYDFPKIGKRNIQVNSIDEEDNHIGAGGVGASAWSDVSEFEPIPLTPEILEKNGFVKITEDMVWTEHLNPKLAEIPTWGLKIGERPVPYLVAKMRDNNHFKITTTNIELFEFNVEHVHQLQHTLRLAGIDKEIEL